MGNWPRYTLGLGFCYVELRSIPWASRANRKDYAPSCVNGYHIGALVGTRQTRVPN